ncbi:hypothetical protein ABPG74_005687 [Tetrahymena malaccensis]
MSYEFGKHDDITQNYENEQKSQTQSKPTIPSQNNQNLIQNSSNTNHQDQNLSTLYELQSSNFNAQVQDLEQTNAQNQENLDNEVIQANDNINEEEEKKEEEKSDEENVQFQVENQDSKFEIINYAKKRVDQDMIQYSVFFKICDDYKLYQNNIQKDVRGIVEMKNEYIQDISYPLRQYEEVENLKESKVLYILDRFVIISKGKFFFQVQNQDEQQNQDIEIEDFDIEQNLEKQIIGGLDFEAFNNKYEYTYGDGVLKKNQERIETFDAFLKGLVKE